MKTSDVPSNKPVQSGTDNKAPRIEKKPQKEFDKVLNDPKGQKGTLLKKEKPFSPLGARPAYDKKTLSSDKKDVHTAARGEGKSEKEGTRATEHREHSRIEAKGERDHAGSNTSKKESSLELSPAQLQTQSTQPQTNVQQVSATQATQKPGLNIEEIQSIVKRCEVAINEKGKPEFRFELQTKNLGNIDLKIHTENEKVHIEFATQDIQAQEAIKENLKELSDMLQQKGLMLAETKFEQRGQDSEKQEKERERQEQGEDISPIEGGPRRKFRL